ncbi:MAG: MFS transporter, partial [Candidatus Marinimicrobia bacterium]|nr:MFS transporter [Candidatus Neomarinimicrobiota bacterium]
IASGGFWAIKEPIKENYSGKKYTILELLKTVPSIIKSDRNLKYFILLKNISGVGMMIFPFYIALAKERFGLSGQEIGNYLFFQIAGAVISVKLWAIINKRFGYKHILALCLLMSTGLPFLALYLGNLTPAWYTIIFFFSGFAASARGMSIEPVFISISTDENRAMYAGVVGVSLIITALIPILGGFLIHNFGFTSVFVAASFILLSGLPVLKNIRIKV